MPEKLQKRNLTVNDEKTEEFTISRDKKHQDWKDCKILGSKLDTKKDIARRKMLTIAAMKDLKPIFKNHRVSTGLKIRTFQAYVNPIFLYNSELWTLNASDIKGIDGFHRRQLRNALNVVWPKKMSTEESNGAPSHSLEQLHIVCAHPIVYNSLQHRTLCCCLAVFTLLWAPVPSLLLFVQTNRFRSFMITPRKRQADHSAQDVQVLGTT